MSQRKDYTTGSLSSGSKAPWKKLLYLHQDYPDNYTDTSFLSQLRRNTTVAKYSYTTVVDHFSLVTMHFSGLITVLLVFTHIYKERISSTVPAVVCSAVSALCYFVLTYSSTNTTSLRPFVVITIILLILSPVLRSLTQSTSLDSIWALSFILCVVSLISHDYDMHPSPPHQRPQYRPVVSTNVALLNAIVLASRLRTTTQVFCFVLFAVETSILLPWFDATIRRNGQGAMHRVIFATIWITSSILVLLLDIKALGVWIVATFGISFGLPAYFLFLQKYKNELQGPWDMAKPVINQPRYRE